MKYQKYLVTGAKDPVGRLVVQMLLAEGCQVRVLVPPESDYSLLRGMGAEIAEGEIIDKDSLKDFLTVEDPRNSAVIHTEEILSISNNKNMDMRRTNVAGAQNMIDMSMRMKIGRFVYLGSAYSLDPDTALSGEKVRFDRTKVDGDYAATKAEASAYLMEKITFNKFNASLLLPTFIIGPGFNEDYDMNKILKKYLENKVSTVSGGHAFVDVRNVASALVAVCENGQTGGTYILNGEYKSAQEFFSDVNSASGSEKVKEMPKWAQSKSMDKLVNTFYRVTKKDNPKEVYALFINNPDANYESTVDGILPDSEVRKVHDSLVDVLTRPGNEVLPDRIDLEKSAEAAKNAKPVETKEEVSQVSEAVLKRAEESAAKAALSNEEAEKRAAAAAAARERVQAKIEAARMKAEQQAEIARAEGRAAAAAEAEKSAGSDEKKAEADDAKTDETKEEKPADDGSLISKISIADIMAQQEAKRAAEKEAEEAKAEEPEEKPAEAEVSIEDIPEVTVEEIVEKAEEKVEEVAEEAVEEKVDETVEETVEAAAEEVAEEVVEEATEAVEEVAEAAEEVTEEVETAEEAVEETVEAAEEVVEEAVEPEAEEPAAEEKAEEAAPADDNSNKPLWERLSGEEISEEEIFGEDNF